MQRTVDHDLAERNLRMTYTHDCPVCGGDLTHDWHENTEEDYVTRTTRILGYNHRLVCLNCKRQTKWMGSKGEAMEATKGWAG